MDLYKTTIANNFNGRQLKTKVDNSIPLVSQKYYKHQLLRIEVIVFLSALASWEIQGAKKEKTPNREEVGEEASVLSTLIKDMASIRMREKEAEEGT